MTIKPIIIQNDCPIETLYTLLEIYENQCPLFIETDLKNIKLDSDFFKKYYSTFQWHFRDSHRSLIQRMHRKLNRYEFSYFDRIHDYFDVDQIEICREKPNNVVCCWDSRNDFTNSPKPCLLTMKFIRDKQYLHISVNFRTRDIIRRMFPNWIALRCLLEQEARLLNKKPGKIFDYSHQIMAKEEDVVKLRNIFDQHPISIEKT